MSAYGSLVRVRFLALLQYRSAALAGIGTQLFWGLIRVMIFEAFYRNLKPGANPGLTHTQMVSYVWLGQAMLGLLPWGTDAEIRDKIRSGAVAYDLLRPLDVYNHWYCRAIAARTAPTLLKSIPLFLVAGCFFGMHPPASLAAAGSWIAFTAIALMLNCAFTNFVSITMLWTISGEGVTRLAPPLVYALSGMMAPLQFLPVGVQNVVNLLPFRNMVDVPFRAYVGALAPADVIPAALNGLLWTFALVIAGRMALSCGLRRLVVQGG